MSEAKATARPWEDDNHGSYIWAEDEKGRFPVAQTRGWGHLTGGGGLRLSEDDAIAVQKANSALIVRAVNSHDEMRDCLQSFVTFHGGHVLPPELQAVQGRAREVLEAVDGQIAKEEVDK